MTLARRWTTAALGLSALLLTTPAAVAAEKETPVSWKKTTIEGKFRSEGVAVADVNKDGKNDVLIGDSWYEAPNWEKHDIRKPGDFGDGLHSYSECMTCWADDVNGDGWVDQLVIGFPGKAAYWYENPQGKAGHWPQHEIWHSACNETPLYTDLFGDGKRVLVMGWQPKGKDNEGQMAWFTPGSDPTQPWQMHAVSEPSKPNKPTPGTFRFSHGLGVGDLNRDGRNDVICTDGWWEQPESGRKTETVWTFHPAQLQGAVADMVVYDVNNDGKNDVIDSSAHQYGMWWYEQGAVKDGSPTFAKHDLFPDLVSETHALNAADINGDGLKDLITGKRFWSHGRSEAGSDKPAKLYWFEASRSADGMTTFTPREIDDQSGIGTQFVVTDFNGDGLLDIVTSNKKGVFLLEQSRPAPAQAKAKAAPATKGARATPTFADVAYGDQPRQLLDFYQAESKTPTPLVVFIHGGGWVNGDKSGVSQGLVNQMRKEGISVASINYRYTTQADNAGIKPPVKWPLEDAAHAIQFLRSRASVWNIDKTRIGATGGSAGACSSLWLAFHDDMAQPDSPNLISRESTRLTCAAVNGAQTALDPKQLRAWMPNMRYGGHAFGFRKAGQAGRDTEFQTFYDHRDEVLPWIKEYSPYEHVGSGDPAIFLDYPAQDKPPVVGEEQRDPTHSAVMGLTLQDKLREHGVECHLAYPGHKDPEYAGINEFLIAKLRARASE